MFATKQSAFLSFRKAQLLGESKKQRVALNENLQKMEVEIGNGIRRGIISLGMKWIARIFHE